MSPRPVAPAGARRPRADRQGGASLRHAGRARSRRRQGATSPSSTSAEMTSIACRGLPPLAACTRVASRWRSSGGSASIEASMLSRSCSLRGWSRRRSAPADSLSAGASPGRVVTSTPTRPPARSVARATSVTVAESIAPASSRYNSTARSSPTTSSTSLSAAAVSGGAGEGGRSGNRVRRAGACTASVASPAPEAPAIPGAL